MNKVNSLSKSIPSPECEFIIDQVGEVTKKHYVGEFTCRIPSRKEQCLIDKHRAFLNGDLAAMLDGATLRFHHMISYLRYTLKTDSVPKFWKESDLGYELYDENVVKAIYDKVLEFEVNWLTEIWGEEGVKRFKSKETNESETESEEKTA